MTTTKHPQITVYTMPNCQQCRLTMMWLDNAGATYTTIDLATSHKDIEAVKALGHMKAPVVCADGVGDWSGFRPDLLMRAINITSRRRRREREAAKHRHPAGKQRHTTRPNK